MASSLSSFVDNLSDINKKISVIELSEKFHNTYQLCNEDLNNFALLLRKSVYPYELEEECVMQYIDMLKQTNEEL